MFPIDWQNNYFQRTHKWQRIRWCAMSGWVLSGFLFLPFGRTGLVCVGSPSLTVDVVEELTVSKEALFVHQMWFLSHLHYDDFEGYVGVCRPKCSFVTVYAKWNRNLFLSLMPSSMAALHSLCILSLNHWIFAETIQVWCLGGTSAVLFLRFLPTDICY